MIRIRRHRSPIFTNLGASCELAGPAFPTKVIGIRSRGAPMWRQLYKQRRQKPDASSKTRVGAQDVVWGLRGELTGDREGGCSATTPSRDSCVVNARFCVASEHCHVALHVVIRRKNGSNLDAESELTREINLKPIVSSFSGRDVSGFGTVRPRVQIPGPRPNFDLRSVSRIAIM